MTLTTLRRTERPTGDAMLDAHRAIGNSWQVLWMLVASGIIALAGIVCYVGLGGVE